MPLPGWHPSEIDPKIVRESGAVGERLSQLTQLWTESHSWLWLEGRASRERQDPAADRTAFVNNKVLTLEIISFRIKIIVSLETSGGLVQYSG